MKFVALVSGGKDGIYAAAQLIAGGHELVALLNMRPAIDRQEMDSYMFHSVGCELVDKIATCMGKPLIQHTLHGLSINTKLDYEQTEGDEIEDLYALVAEAKRTFPEIQAVSSGAINSTYQKLRVENVCGRLGLKSIAPLWKREPEQLMRDMIRWGMKAILVRVCADGLKREHLELTLEKAFPILVKLSEKVGVHVCGEGGEFETFVLDCPLYCHGFLSVSESEIAVEVDNGIQYRARVNITGSHVQKKR